MRTTLFLVFVFALVSLALAQENILSNREDADILIQVKPTKKCAQKKAAATPKPTVDPTKSKEQQLVDKIRLLKDELNTDVKKCSIEKKVAKKAKRVLPIKKIVLVKKQKKCVTKTGKAKKCTNKVEIKQLVDKQNKIVKTVKQQLHPVVVTNPPRISKVKTALDVLRKALHKSSKNKYSAWTKQFTKKYVKPVKKVHRKKSKDSLKKILKDLNMKKCGKKGSKKHSGEDKHMKELRQMSKLVKSSKKGKKSKKAAKVSAVPVRLLAKLRTVQSGLPICLAK